MNWKEILELIAIILAGVATAIPLISKLVQLVQENVKQRNWTKLVEIVLELMTDAEGMFTRGTDRKDWVMQGVAKWAGVLNYDIDEDALSALIDSLCDMSKVVNAPTEEGADDE